MKDILAKILILLMLVPAFTYAEIKIGYVMVEKVLKQAPQTAASNKKLEKEFKKRTDALKQAIQTIQKEEKDFAKNSLTLSDTEKEKISRKLQQGKIDAKRDERELREDIDIRRREEINELQTQVNKTIEEIAKDQNFDLIVYQGVAYASPKIDITDQIIKALGN